PAWRRSHAGRRRCHADPDARGTGIAATVARRPDALEARGKGGIPSPAERRTDLRADRRTAQLSRRDGQDADAQRPAKTAQGTQPRDATLTSHSPSRVTAE